MSLSPTYLPFYYVKNTTNIKIIKSVLRKLSIRSHMTFGCICLLCVPIQLILPNTVMCWRRRISRNIHRYTGRLYVICAILSFIFGQWFICLKQFRLVGGYNMGAAFSFAGLFIAYFAYMTWKTAPSKNKRNNSTSTSDNNHNQKYTIENHRNYAIRSFSQIIAPILYRYWYVVMIILRLHVPPPHYNERNNKTTDDDDDVPPSLICDDHNVCPDYERPVDAIFCWLYWISAWIVAEIVIICLPDHKSKSNNINATTATQENQDMEHATLITRIDSMNGEKSFVSVVNFLGCFLAGITIMVTGYILSAIFMPQNN